MVAEWLKKQVTEAFSSRELEHVRRARTPNSIQIDRDALAQVPLPWLFPQTHEPSTMQPLRNNHKLETHMKNKVTVRKLLNLRARNQSWQESNRIEYLLVSNGRLTSTSHCSTIWTKSPGCTAFRPFRDINLDKSPKT